MRQDVVDLLECPNCSTPLSRRYCPQCGQKIGDINPTMHDLLHDVTHEFLHVDSKIYTVVAFHHAYGGAWGLAVRRTAVVLTGYMVVIAVATVLSVVVYAASH